MISYTYYYRSQDKSEFLESSNARVVAEVAHAQGGEVGVMITDDGQTLKAWAWEMGREPIKSMSRWLVFQRRLGVSEACRKVSEGRHAA